MKELFLKKNFNEINIQNLLSLPEKELEKKLALLKFNELLDLVLILPWEERAKVILYSPYPEGLVKNLPPQELFLTLKASSLDLSVELLSYAKGTQIQFMFDIDAWYKDRIKPERVASWLILLFQAGEDKVLEWLRIADWDFLIAIFQKFVKVYKRPDDIDLVEAMDFLPPYTLDDFYFIEFKNDALEFHFRRMIEIIREELPELYMPLMESIIWEIPIEVEERAYRWRNGRLADEGIPEYFEALDIYSYIHPKSIKKIEPKYLTAEDEEESTPPINIMIYEEEKDELFIFKALSLIQDPKQIERIKKELAWITNKVVVVDHVVIDDIEQIRESLEKVWGALNLGLEYLSLENLNVAKRILEEHFLEDIFKVAQTTFKELRKFALELTNSKEFDSSLIKYLDQPYQGYLQGVLVKKINEIKLFQPQKIGTSQEYVVFRKYNQIKMVRRYIEEIGYIAPLIQKAFGSPLGWIQEVNKIGRNFDAKFITWSSLILTALAYWIYNKEFAFKALPRSAWEKTFKELVESKENKVLMKDSIKKELYKNFENLAKAEWYFEPELLQSFLNFVINKFENEFAYVDLKNLPDPKYQTLILIDLTQ